MIKNIKLYLFLLIFAIFLFFILNLLYTGKSTKYVAIIPEKIMFNQEFKIILKNFKKKKGDLLKLDFHWYSKKGEYQGFLKNSLTQGEVSKNGDIIFKEKIAFKNNLACISPVFFQTPNGNWKDRVEVFKLIPIYIDLNGNGGLNFIKTNAYYYNEEYDKNENIMIKTDLDRAIDRFFVIFIYFIYLIIFSMFFYLKKKNFENKKFYKINILFVLFLFVEKIFGIFSLIFGFIRETFRDLGVYQFRKVPQQVFTILLLTFLIYLVLKFYLLYKKKKKFASDFFLYLILAIIIVMKIIQGISLHHIDSLLNYRLLHISIYSYLELFLLSGYIFSLNKYYKKEKKL